jgi:hypothetical protein
MTADKRNHKKSVRVRLHTDVRVPVLYKLGEEGYTIFYPWASRVPSRNIQKSMPPRWTLSWGRGRQYLFMLGLLPAFLPAISKNPCPLAGVYLGGEDDD